MAEAREVQRQALAAKAVGISRGVPEAPTHLRSDSMGCVLTFCVGHDDFRWFLYDFWLHISASVHTGRDVQELIGFRRINFSKIWRRAKVSLYVILYIYIVIHIYIYYTYTMKYIFIIFHFLSAWCNWPGLRGIFRLPRLGASLSTLVWPLGLVVECQQLSNLDEAGRFSQDFLGSLRWSLKN